MTSLAISENPPRQPSILGALATAYVALLPYQFVVGRGMNVAPADCALLLVLVLAAGQLKFRKQLWTVWHVAIGFTFILGSFVAATRFGKLEQYGYSECGSSYGVPSGVSLRHYKSFCQVWRIPALWDAN